jgi:hypothetical protein
MTEHNMFPKMIHMSRNQIYVSDKDMPIWEVDISESVDIAEERNYVFSIAGCQIDLTPCNSLRLYRINSGLSCNPANLICEERSHDGNEYLTTLFWAGARGKSILRMPMIHHPDSHATAAKLSDVHRKLVSYARGTYVPWECTPDEKRFCWL